MKRKAAAAGLCLFFFGWILLNLSQNRTEADTCNIALDVLATCQQQNIAVQCPIDCTGGNQANGVNYSGNGVHTTTAGHSQADGTGQVDCSQSVTCTKTNHPDQKCVPTLPPLLPGFYCDTWIGNPGGCDTYSVTTGNWVPSPDAKAKACPN
jgi:hypothetical protein